MLAWVRSLDSFLERARIRYFGLGLLLAWVYCSWFSHGIFSADNSVAAFTTLRTSLLFSAVGLLAIVFRPHKEIPLKPQSVFASAVVVSAATLLFFIVPSGPLLLAVSAMGGLASALLWVAWGELFCRIDQETAESCIPSSLAVFVLAALVVYLLPSPVSGVVSALLPLVSCMMLLLGENAQQEEYVFPTPKEPFSRVVLPLSRLALCSMACSIATGFVVTGFPMMQFTVEVQDFIVFYIAGGILTGAIAIFAIAHTRRMNFSFLYEWAIPLIVFSLSFCALRTPLSNMCAAVLACSAALCVEVLFYAIFARITAHRLCLPSETFGIFRAVVQLGFLLGGLLNAWATRSGADVVAVCLFLICACVVMLPLFLHLQGRFDEFKDGGEFAVDGAAIGDQEETSAYGRQDAMDEIAKEFKLSAREAEVLQYLGRGRSVPYMREAMMISKSTIETHIKHIYAKTNVHSKQELLDLIEARLEEHAQ